MTLHVPLHAPSFYTADPAPHYRRLRRDAPVYWHAERGWWALSRWEDIRQVSIQPELFCSSEGIMIPEAGNDETQQQVDSLIFTDPPRHRALRKMVKRSFMPANLRRLEPRIRELVSGLVDGLERGRQLDFAEEVAGPLPTIVIAEMLGAPTEDWPRFRIWTDAVIGFLRDAFTEGGNFTLDSEPPFMVIGDLNLVTSRRPLDVVLTGVVIDKDSYGPDFPPGPARTPLEAVPIRHSDAPFTYTWHTGDTKYYSARLDWALVPSGVAVERAFVLDTGTMFGASLRKSGLNRTDSREASDHMPIVVDVSWE